MTDTEFSRLSIADLVPNEWDFPSQCSIWMSAYLTFYMPEEQILTPAPDGLPPYIDLEEMRAIAIRGHLPGGVQSHDQLLSTISGLPQIVTRIEDQSPPGTYLVVIARVDGPPESANEAIARSHVNEAITLLRLKIDRNIAFAPFIEGALFSAEQVTTYATTQENPFFFEPPDFSQNRRRETELLAKRIGTAEHPERVRLSLRWAKRGQELDSTDAFLAWWIAIETIAGNNKRVVNAVNQQLSALYPLEVPNPRDRFAVGRLFGHRNKIVHEGDVKPVPHELLQYLEALFSDLLHATCGLPSARLEGLPISASDVRRLLAS